MLQMIVNQPPFQQASPWVCHWRESAGCRRQDADGIQCRLAEEKQTATMIHYGILTMSVFKRIGDGLGFKFVPLLIVGCRLTVTAIICQTAVRICGQIYLQQVTE